MIQAKFGPLTEASRLKLEQLDVESELTRLATLVLTASRLDELGL